MSEPLTGVMSGATNGALCEPVSASTSGATSWGTLGVQFVEAVSGAAEER